MKNILTTMACILSAFLMTGCFKDQGNYIYTEVDAPTWLFSDYEQIYIYEGDSVKYKAAFRFEKDSIRRLANVRYEWRVRGVVISEKRDLFESGDTIIKKLNLKEFPSSFIIGTFCVIEKETGVTYMYKRLFNIYPRYSRGTWLILSENGGNSRLTTQQKKNNSGSAEPYYQTVQDIYKNLNGSDIPGKPRRMLWHEARHISPSVGAMTIVTDQVAYELNCETLLKYEELKDQFLDGTPANFKISDVYYGSTISFIATEDGCLFRRIMADSWLGGKYMTEPYIVDEKGTVVKHFGHGTNVEGRDANGFPCYDEKNRRVMLINFSTPKGKIFPATPDAGEHALKIWDMEDGTEVLRLSQVTKDEETKYDTDLNSFVLIYNNQEGTTYMSNFYLKTQPPGYYAHCIVKGEVKPFPGGNLDSRSLFLTTLSPSYFLRNYIMYTKGNELRYVDRVNDMDYPLMTFEKEITAIRYASYTENYGKPNYTEIAVGLANGDFMILNIEDIDSPFVIEKSKINVGGPIKEVAQISMPLGYDYY